MLFQNILKTLIISRTEIFVTSQAEVFSSEFFVLVVMEGGGGGGSVLLILALFQAKICNFHYSDLARPRARFTTPS